MLRKFPAQLCRVAVGALLAPSLAFAALNLKKVNIVDGNQIELLFDGKVDSGQVKTEFVRDNIQLSLTNASVYPAKVSMVSGSDLTKVFAYQYSPALVRARFTVKGEAADYANRLQVKISGKTVTVRIADAKADQVASAASSALRVAAAPAAEKESEAPTKVEKAERAEKVEKVEKSERAEKESKGILERVADSAAPAKSAVASERGTKTRELAGGKAVTSPFRSIGVMLFVLGVFGLFVMFLKRIKGGEGKSFKGAKGLGGFLNKLSGASGSKTLIEVVATHHLAPKRSIVVVRIQDRMLVLGMTNDNMNLITEFRSNDEGDAEENIPIGDFAASLKKFETEDLTPARTAKVSQKANLGDIAAAALGLAKPKPASALRANAAANAYQNAGTSTDSSTGPSVSAGPVTSALAEAMKQPSVKPNIRAQIKDRVQGMKQL